MRGFYSKFDIMSNLIKTSDFDPWIPYIISVSHSTGWIKFSCPISIHLDRELVEQFLYRPTIEFRNMMRELSGVVKDPAVFNYLASEYKKAVEQPIELPDTQRQIDLPKYLA